MTTTQAAPMVEAQNLHKGDLIRYERHTSEVLNVETLSNGRIELRILPNGYLASGLAYLNFGQLVEHAGYAEARTTQPRGMCRHSSDIRLCDECW